MKNGSFLLIELADIALLNKHGLTLIENPDALNGRRAVPLIKIMETSSASHIYHRPTGSALWEA